MYRSIFPNDDRMAEIDQYYKVVRPYFQVCSGKSVLEIGPFSGVITDLYCNIADKIELVEPNSTALETLQRAFPQAPIVWDDIFAYLKTPRKFDVVVCLGVLYHLHSPIQLLEQLTNEVRPNYLLVDTSATDMMFEGENGRYFSLGLNAEEINQPGNYYTRPGKPGLRSPGLNLTGFGPHILTEVMAAMGYRALCEPIMSPVDFKKEVAFVAFERID
jgi:SAM-dependent methyltransferase